ncbi:hypothetical protein BV898_19986, partial [Hypsibius exemplaris]
MTHNQYSSFAGALLILFALVLLDILSRDVSALHTWRSAADQYLALTVLGRLGCYCHGAMLKDTENLSNTQEELLKNFLSANAATEYGKRYEFARITSREDFVRVHPLTGYGDVEGYIERMVAGETEVLTKDQPKMFAVTSGTSGKTSVLPFLRKQQRIFFLRGITVMSYCMAKVFPESKMLRK